MILTTKKSFKYRLYPAKSQITNFENQFSMCRHLFNWSLAERIEMYQKSKGTISYYIQQNNLINLKKERPWYKSVHSQVLQDTLKRLDKAYQNFFRRVKQGETPGFPKFKKRGQWNSITYPQYSCRPNKSVVKVPKIGNVKIVYHREIPGNAKIKTMTITKEGGKWFACFSVELSLDIELKQDSPAIGIDLGLIDFIYDSNGDSIKAPRYFRQLQKKLAKLQRRFAKAPKRSVKWYKLLKAIQKCHYRTKCQRQDFLHKTANSLLNKANVIIHENLNIQGMSRRPKPKQDEDGTYLPNGASWKGGLNKSISDAGWYQFTSILRYKAIEQGKQIIAVPPHYTSQRCSSCGEIVKKSLSTRTHSCPFCSFVANRDHNAAINILAIGTDSLVAKAA